MNALDAFHLQMCRAQQDARFQGVPHCPLQADERVTVGDTVYAVNWTSRGGASKTMALDATVTNLSTGRSYGVEGVIRKLLRSGNVQYTLPRKGVWTGREAASLGLAELTARRTGALTMEVAA